MMDILRWLFEANFQIGSGQLLVRDVVGNFFGLLSALGGMRRKAWAWPVGIVGNVLLLTVFVGSVFGNADTANLLGQAGRQIMFIVVSIYGWRQWSGRNNDGHALVPRWATNRERGFLIIALLLGTVALTPVFRSLGSYEPVWADAWTFMGSLLATYGMARGLVEFWLIWVAVDVVGVPLLFSAGYYATGVMYLIYGLFTLVGFFVWSRARHVSPPRSVEPDPAGPLVRQ